MVRGSLKNAPSNEDPGHRQTFVYNLRFPGQYYDSETGTAYNGFRDYDPAIERYVESDLAGLYGGLNSYSYVGDNPLTRMDLVGLWSFSFGAYAGVGGTFSLDKTHRLVNGFMVGD